MIERTSNDNHAVGANRPQPGADPHGQAAMLLVESLMHGLIARQVISVADAIEMVEVASEVTEEVAADLGDTPGALQQSLTMLSSLRLSLRNDCPG